MNSPTRVIAKKIVQNAIEKQIQAEAIAKIRKIVRNVTNRKTRENSTAYPGGYRLTKPVITGRTVTFTCDFSRFDLPMTLPRGFISIEGRVAMNRPAVARVTKTHGLVVSSPGVANHWFIKTTYGFAVVHRKGSVQVTTPNTTGRVVEQLKRIGLTLTSPRVTKFDASMRIDKYLIFREIEAANPLECNYEPELISKLFVRSKSPAMTLVISPGGLIQIFGASKPSDAVIVMRRLIERTTPERAFRHARFEGVRNVLNAPMKAKTRSEKLAKTREAKLYWRHKPAFGYNQVPPPGQYIRPGPNGKPRLYTIPENPKLSAAKVEKAYEKAGVQMPNHVKNIFRTYNASMVWYGAPSAALRAPSWNAKKNGYYVAPGPGKQPHFYKLPKNLVSGFKTVQSRYSKAQMNVPAHIRTMFGVGTSAPVYGASRPTNHSVRGNAVNGKSYTKFTTNQLVSIARNLGNAGANAKMTKAVLFERIKSKATIKKESPVRAPNVSVNGRTYIFSNDPLDQRIIRNGKKRTFSTLPKAEREAIARTYLGANANTINSKNWYNAMRAKKMFST